MNRPRAEALADASAFFMSYNATPRRFLLPTAGLLLLAIALSQPCWGVERKTTNRPLDNLWFVVDVGSTMRCRDLPGGRGEFAKSVAEFVARDWTGKIRVSVFDRDARLVSPATSDHRRSQRMIEGLIFDQTSASSVASVVEHVLNEPLNEPFLGVVLTDGGSDEGVMQQPSTTNGRWIVVGLGDASHPSPVPAPNGGWLIEMGVPVVSKRNVESIETLAAALNASVSPAWPDAEAVAARILQQSRRPIGESESAEVVPREQFQWFAAAALMLLFQPWKWRFGVTPMAVLFAFFLNGSAFAMDGANAYRSARSELADGRWAEAKMKFEELTKDRDLLGWAHWGSGCASASLANETDDVSRRRELTARAIRSFREAVRSLRDPAERTAVMKNIGLVKRLLMESANKSPSESRWNSDVVKKEDSENVGASSVGEANPNLDRKAGSKIGGGSVHNPVAGLRVADPGPLTRAQAEAMLDAVVDQKELGMIKRAGGRPKQ